MENQKKIKTNSSKIRQSVKALQSMSLEGRVQLLVRAGIVSQAEVNKKVSTK